MNGYQIEFGRLLNASGYFFSGLFSFSVSARCVLHSDFNFFSPLNHINVALLLFDSVVLAVSSH